jgi:hypothetical protein
MSYDSRCTPAGTLTGTVVKLSIPLIPCLTTVSATILGNIRWYCKHCNGDIHVPDNISHSGHIITLNSRNNLINLLRIDIERCYNIEFRPLTLEITGYSAPRFPIPTIATFNSFIGIYNCSDDFISSRTSYPFFNTLE